MIGNVYVYVDRLVDDIYIRNISLLNNHQDIYLINRR